MRYQNELPSELRIRGKRPEVCACHRSEGELFYWYISTDDGQFIHYLVENGCWRSHTPRQFPTRESAIEVCYQFADLPPGWRIHKWNSQQSPGYVASHVDDDDSKAAHVWPTAREAYLAVQAASQPSGKPTVVCLCGSTRFYQQFQEANYRETMAGRIVLSVGFYPHAQELAHGEEKGCTAEQKVALDELHKRKIDLADEVLILDVGGYIGQSTRGELEYAKEHGKRVRMLSQEPAVRQAASQPAGTQGISRPPAESSDALPAGDCELPSGPGVWRDRFNRPWVWQTSEDGLSGYILGDRRIQDRDRMDLRPLRFSLEAAPRGHWHQLHPSAETERLRAEVALSLVRIKGEPRGYDDTFWVEIEGETARDANDTPYPMADLEIVPVHDVVERLRAAHEAAKSLCLKTATERNQLRAERDGLQKELDAIAAEVAKEGPHDIEHLLACATIGKHTTVIGKSRHKQLVKAEEELTALRERVGSVEAELEKMSAEAQAIEDRYNSDDYDGDLDADEQLAEAIWECCRRVSRSLAPTGQSSGESRESPTPGA